MRQHISKSRRSQGAAGSPSGDAAFQLELIGDISEDSSHAGANGATTPPPPDHNGGVSSTMTNIDSSTAGTPPQPRRTYSQDWAAYNAAQTNEGRLFPILLRQLCDYVDQPLHSVGRPRLPMSDMLFSIGLKVYSTLSGRRAMTEINDAQVQGFLEKAPSFTSVFRYLENPDITPILQDIVGRSSLPMSVMETNFAADSTGFSTSSYSRWFDHKWGKNRSERKWIKTHLLVGVKTHIVVGVLATPGESADAPQLPELIRQAQKHFTIDEVYADKAYSSKQNLWTVHASGGVAFIPFKAYVRGTQRHGDHDILWQKMWHYFQFRQPEFMQHYHRRSNVESAIAMIKQKFGSSVRTRNPIAQVNEVLFKVLAHNICVLIEAWYELGIEATFQGDCSKIANCSKSLDSVPKMAWE